MGGWEEEGWEGGRLGRRSRKGREYVLREKRKEGGGREGGSKGGREGGEREGREASIQVVTYELVYGGEGRRLIWRGGEEVTTEGRRLIWRGGEEILT